MYTGGYDIALQIKEDVLNKVLAALFYKGFFYIKKDFKLHSDRLPAALTDLTEITYKVKLVNAPMLDFIADDTANILLNTQVIFYLLNTIEVKLDADFSATIQIVYDDTHHSLKLDFPNAAITSVALNNKLALDEPALKRINEIIKFIVQNDLLQSMETVTVPVSIFQLKVPTVPETNKLSVNRFDCKIMGDSLFRAGIDLFHNTVGDFNSIQLGTQADYTMAITEKVIQQIIDFWWEYTTTAKTIVESKSDNLDKIQNFVNDVVKVAEVALEVATLGILDQDTTFSNTTLNYGATIILNKPTIDILAGDEFSIINTTVEAKVWANIKTDITTKTDVFWGLINVSSNTVTGVTILSVTDDITVTLKNVKGKVYLNDQLELKGKIEQVDVDINFGQNFIEKLTTLAVNAIMDWLKGFIIAHLPELTLFPKVIDVNVSSLGYDVEIDPQELSTTDDEVRIGLNVGVKELKKITTALPGFIANKNTMEVHRDYCDVLDEMNEANKVGYYLLLEAIKDGYDACGKCIPWYSKR